MTEPEPGPDHGALLQAVTALVTDPSTTPAQLRAAVEERTEGGSPIDQLRNVAAKLGLELDVLSMSPRFVDGAAHLGHVLLWSPSHRAFVEVEPSRRRTTTVRVLSGPKSKPLELEAGGLALFLGVDETTEVSVVHAREVSPLQFLARRPSDSPSPWRRLGALVRKERKDLWLAVLYAVGVGVLSLAVPIAVQSLFDTVSFGTVTQPIVVLGAILMVALACAAVLMAFEHVILEWIGRRIFVSSSTDFGSRAARIDAGLHHRQHMPELFNRFFDVVTVEKSLVELAFDGLSSALQILVGLTLLAIYHPFLLAFAATLLGVLAFITIVLGRGAIRSAIAESKAKYKMADWIQNVAGTPSTFRSRTGQAFAWEKTEYLVHHWLDARGEHFKVKLRQIVAMLMLQVLSTVLLLMVGGLLVIEGQLTLGQLVAAEILMALTVASLAKMRTLYGTTYDLLASLDKYGNILDPSLTPMRDTQLSPVSEGLHLEIQTPDGQLTLEPGERLAVLAHRYGDVEQLVERILGLSDSPNTKVRLDHRPVGDLDPGSVGDHVMILRSEELFAGTVRENLTLGLNWVRSDRLWEVLRSVGLADRVRELDNRLETKLLPGGRPFSRDERVALLAARALIVQPKLLILPQTLDLLSRSQRKQMMNLIGDRRHGWSVLILTEQADVVDGMGRQPIKEVVA
jgi:putative ABC transport system ATP-binding protein